MADASMTDDYQRLPHMCPVPVRPLEMTSLHPEHQDLAVVTDLERMGGIGLARTDPSELLYADFQLGAWSNSVLRQGSGRSGFYKGHYVKGTGRTPLAANWNDHRDWYHGSGHLFPTSAVREYLVTVYLEARGQGDRLVPCRGLLLGRLLPHLRDALATEFGGDAFDDLAPIDRALMAISAKPAGFARASNFLWLVTRLSGRGEDWRYFLPMMEQYAEPDLRLTHPLETTTPSSLADALGRAARRALDGLDRDFGTGVLWNSLWNNITLDGRMLDLEVATFACRPFVGATTVFGSWTGSPGPEGSRPRRLRGLETIDHAVELRLNLSRLASEVQKLLDMPIAFDGQEVRFMEAVVSELRRVASDASLLGDDALVERAARALGGLTDVPPEALGSEIRAYAEERARVWAKPALSHLILERAPLEFRRVEPNVHLALWLPPGAYVESEWDDARFMAEQLERIEACTDVDRALAEIAGAADAIRGRWADLPAR